MGGEEIEYGGEDYRIAYSGAQGIGGEAGERQQAFGTALALQEPAERTEREGLRINRG